MEKGTWNPMLKGTWRRKGKSHLQNLEREGEGSKEAREERMRKERGDKERGCIAKKREIESASGS